MYPAIRRKRLSQAELGHEPCKRNSEINTGRVLYEAHFLWLYVVRERTDIYANLFDNMPYLIAFVGDIYSVKMTLFPSK
jgi:hypothetical protein